MKTLGWFRKPKVNVEPVVSNYLRTARLYHKNNETGMLEIGEDESGVLIANCSTCGANGVILQEHKCWKRQGDTK